MKRVDIEAPLRLTRGFWTIYVALFVPVLWLTWPVYSHLPLYAQIAGIVLFPFLAAVVSYCTLYFVLATVTGTPAEKYRARLLVVGVLVVAVLSVFLQRTHNGTDSMFWDLAAGAALVIASRFFLKKPAN